MTRIALLVAAALICAACSTTAEPDALAFEEDIAPRQIQEPYDGPVLDVDGDRFVLHTPNGTRSFLNGINLGPTIPGHQPGELAPSSADIARWLVQISDFGFNVIRVYTIQQPHFYDELLAFNLTHPESPLYVMHGIWIPEEEFLASRDLFASDVVTAMRSEVDDAVDVIHGDANLPDRRGHASGSYTSDISPWLAGWIVGVELDPPATRTSNDTNADREPYDGTFFTSTPDANATETWYAEMLDLLATRMDERDRQVPVAFTNWPTTDPLIHPDEPLETEDMVQLDANRVQPTTAWSGGYFASYHAYPYYPDFQRYEAGIADYVTADGVVDNYAGYLQKLRTHHAGIPVLISEFGVPSGTAYAHSGPLDRDQGAHTEQNQMQINADLLHVIHDEGLAGGFLFEWSDEWFKLTWNTLDLELPADRRAMWKNEWTNEAHFGILAVEPGNDAPPALIDGDASEWEDNASQVIAETDSEIFVVRAVKDEGYLYLSLELEESFSDDDTLVIGIDVLTDEGGGLPETEGASERSDYAIVLRGTDDGEAFVATYNNSARIFAGTRGWLDGWDPNELTPGQATWHRQQLITNRPLTIPSTGEETPLELFDVGLLVGGTSDPQDPAFDARTAFAIDDKTIELRLPHALIGFSDPSSLQAYRIQDDGAVRTETVERVGIDLVLNNVVIATNGYAWEQWQSVTWHERLKAGADVYADAVRATDQSQEAN